MKEFEYKIFPITDGFIINSGAYYRIRTFIADSGSNNEELLYRVTRKIVSRNAFPYIEVELFSKVLQLGESKRKKDWQKMDNFRSKVISMYLLEEYKINAALFKMSNPEHLKSIVGKEKNPEYLFCFYETMQIWERKMLEKYKNYKSYSLESKLESNNPQE